MTLSNADILERYPRLAVAGGPRTGKTTLAMSMRQGRFVLSTDALMKLKWEEVPHEVIKICTPMPRFIVEGVQVARSLRKGLEVDAVLWMSRPKAMQTSKQIAMGKGVKTVFDEWVSGCKADVFIEGPNNTWIQKQVRPR